MTPMNAVFRKLWQVFSRFSEVTDSLTDNKGYPFIHMKESYDQEGNNSELTGTITQVIDVWGLKTQRNEVDRVVSQIRRESIFLDSSFDYYTRLRDFRTEQIPDNTTGTSYVRYRIEADFFYTKKRGKINNGSI